MCVGGGGARGDVTAWRQRQGGGRDGLGCSAVDPHPVLQGRTGRWWRCAWIGSRDMVPTAATYTCAPLNPFLCAAASTPLQGIKQFFVAVEREEWKFDTLCDLYDTLTITQAVIFCATKRKVGVCVLAGGRRGWAEGLCSSRLDGGVAGEPCGLVCSPACCVWLDAAAPTGAPGPWTPRPLPTAHHNCLGYLTAAVVPALLHVNGLQPT